MPGSGSDSVVNIRGKYKEFLRLVVKGVQNPNPTQALGTSDAISQSCSVVDMQVPFGILLHGGGGKESSQGGMQGQSFQPPQALRSQEMSSEGRNPHHPQAEPASVLQPTLSMPQPSMAMRMGVSQQQGGGSGEQPPKRKRGRPRKYTGTEQPSHKANPANISVSPKVTDSMLFSDLAKQIASPYPPPEKRGRGRPPGSTKKQALAALGVVLAGTGKSFTPHILTVNAGEDASAKIMQFAQHGTRAMCVLSANGAVSNVMLRQDSSSGGTVTYEGRYEILSLSGSYLPKSGDDGDQQRTGTLSVSLAGSDGRVFGGGVAGILMAASPIQVVVGSFLFGPFKTEAKAESPLASTQEGTPGVVTMSATYPQPSVPRSDTQGTSAGGPQQRLLSASPSCESSEQIHPQGIAVYQPSEGWTVAPPLLADGRRTDINISLAGG